MVNGSEVVNAFHAADKRQRIGLEVSCDLLNRVCSRTFSSCMCCWSLRGAEAHTRRAVCYAVAIRS